MQKDTHHAVALMEQVLAGIVDSIGKTSGARGRGRPRRGRAGRRRPRACSATVERDGRRWPARSPARSRENACGAQEISAAAQKMNQLTHQMSEAVAEQKRGGEMVVKAVEAIAVVSRQNLVAVEQMNGAAKSLAGESDALRQRVAVFQV